MLLEVSLTFKWNKRRKELPEPQSFCRWCKNTSRIRGNMGDMCYPLVCKCALIKGTICHIENVSNSPIILLPKVRRCEHVCLTPKETTGFNPPLKRQIFQKAGESPESYCVNVEISVNRTGYVVSSVTQKFKVRGRTLQWAFTWDAATQCGQEKLSVPLIKKQKIGVNLKSHIVSSWTLKKKKPLLINA